MNTEKINTLKEYINNLPINKYCLRSATPILG